ncbi:lactonase family protein [Saccharopolyspora flava]|uniref:6-phosphogluconolactonase, cycloisomerase 2 family n=1 Tax=Saccharopolyspora flava TaxID=95161 RepID=A0A1I6RDT1_9PSEU|nr:lactonase family protein [Saccharopolyspora flava]SFS62901.1 6-phosphogluconolactonase, cycloisomerase 2 family [Saccharopolyspora flava]
MAGSFSRRGFLSAVGALGVAGATVGCASAAGRSGAAAVHAHAPAHEGLMTFIGSYTSSQPAGRGVDVAMRDMNGVLAPSGTLDGVADASFFAWSPDHKFLYVTNEQPQGSITAIDVSTHEPRIINTAPSGGNAPTHLSVHPDGEYVLTAHYGDGTVAVHRRNPDGGIGENTALVRHPGAEPHAHQVLVDPSGKWVVSVDLGADSVFVHAFDAGKLTQHQQLALPAGTGPRHLVFKGTTAYLVAELNSTITVLGWDPEAGNLTAGQVISSRAPEAAGENFPAEIVISRDGKFVYATNRGDDTVAVFAVNDGQLTFHSAAPSGGNWPRHCALDPEETSLFVANQRAGTITRLARDPETGALTPTPDSYACPSVAAITFHG